MAKPPVTTGGRPNIAKRCFRGMILASTFSFLTVCKPRGQHNLVKSLLQNVSAKNTSRVGMASPYFTPGFALA